MAYFLTALDYLGKDEGGYVNNPHDSGGETYKGIARKKNPTWCGWPMIDQKKQDMAADFPACLETDDILQAAVQVFYRQLYWNAVEGDLINSQDVANKLFDSAVLVSVKRAVLLLQHAYNNVFGPGGAPAGVHLDEDGMMGPKTVAAVNWLTNPDKLLWFYRRALKAFLDGVANENPDDEIFRHGWELRAEK